MRFYRPNNANQLEPPAGAKLNLDGVIALADGIKNNGAVEVKAKLYIDGNVVGRFRVRPGVDYEAIERPVDVAKKFTFYTVCAVRTTEGDVTAYVV